MSVWKISMHAHAYSIHQHMRESFQKKLVCYFYIVHVWVGWYYVKQFSFIQEKKLYSINVRRNAQNYQGGWLIHGIELLTYWTTFLFSPTFVVHGQFVHPAAEVCEPEFAEIMNKIAITTKKLRLSINLF